MLSEFEWDPVKAESNVRKHGVSFENAKLAFFDLHGQYESDAFAGEMRFNVIGYALEELLFVVFAVRETAGLELFRIISARAATPKERRKYEEQNG